MGFLSVQLSHGRYVWILGGLMDESDDENDTSTDERVRSMVSGTVCTNHRRSDRSIQWLLGSWASDHDHLSGKELSAFSDCTIIRMIKNIAMTMITLCYPYS